MICSFDGCGRVVLARGFCNAHYAQFRKHGEVCKINERTTTPDQHFAWLQAHVDFAGDDCLKWPFRTKPNGRGAIFWNGAEEGAHRLMCELRHGSPPSEKHEAAHSCGKGHEGCVNPNHLRWATAVENWHDRYGHGTDIRGSRHHKTKLTDVDVVVIRVLGLTLKNGQIGERYGLHHSQIARIIRRESWSHI